VSRMKLIKSTIALFVMSSMMFTMACSNNTNNEQQNNNTTTKVEEEKGPYDDLKIGVVNIGSSTDSSGYTFAHTNGIKGMMSALNLRNDQVIYKDNVPDDAPDTIRDAIKNCINKGCKIIFTTSYGFQEVTYEMAEKYPSVYFSHCSGKMSNGKNMNRYFGRIYQPFYLAGIAAGLKTKTDKIGFVSAFGTAVSESAYCLNAFAMGVESVNKKAKVITRVINCWDDEKKERTAAEKLVKAGVDVIGQDTDSSMPQKVAEENNIYGVGYNNDMRKDAPNATLVSVIWNWEKYYTDTVKDICADNWDVQNYYGGLKEGIVDITELSELNDKKAEKKIKDVVKMFNEGTWDVFNGKIVTNTGKTIGENNVALSGDEIQFNINWLYKNIKVDK